jgi:hypothetical protein
MTPVRQQLLALPVGALVHVSYTDRIKPSDVHPVEFQSIWERCLDDKVRPRTPWVSRLESLASDLTAPIPISEVWCSYDNEAPTIVLTPLSVKATAVVEMLVLHGQGERASRIKEVPDGEA